MAIELNATEPVKITAKGKDSEGNAVELGTTDLAVTAEATEGDFGTINDEMDTFNPGEAGAKGFIRGSVTIDEKPYTAEVEVTLVAGGLSELELEFTPVAEQPVE